LLALGREQPDKFLACLVTLDALPPKAEQRDAEPTGPTKQETAQGAPDQQKDGGGTTMAARVVVSAKPRPCDDQLDGRVAARDRPADGPTVNLVVRGGHLPKNVMGLFVPELYLVQQLKRYRASVPSDVRVVGCAMDRTEAGILFTIASQFFVCVAEGEPIPELKPMFASGR
jgi:hypothetical protein